MLKLAKLLLLIPLVALASPVLADDDEDEFLFTDESVKGTWGFSASGTIVPPAFLEPTAAVAVGIMDFDGEGLCVITDTVNIGGQSASRTSTECFYEVNPDGSGTLDVLFPGDLGPVPLSFVLVHDANAFRFIRTDLGVASGVAERQGEFDEDDD